MAINKEKEKIKKAIGTWISAHTRIASVSKDTLEIATTQIDSYGDTIYCFVQKKGKSWIISDDGNLLFKLDPGATDAELYETAEEIALGAGFEFDKAHCCIFIETDRLNLAQAVIKLAQLQAAISYLD